MGIMAMATVRIINIYSSAKFIALLSLLAISTSSNGRDWQFTPNFAIEETYTDNVELATIDPLSSLVSQAIVGLDIEYKSRVANFSLTGENSNIFYSHDQELKNNYLTLNSDGNYYLWTSGPLIFANASIGNVNRNSANNGISDLISGDTVQSENYSTGLRYQVNNSTFSLESSITYSISRYEDGLGEYNGVSAIFNTQNNNNARLFFWQLNSSFSTRSQDFSGETRTGEQYIFDANFGVITPFKFSPFIRFYDEGFSGDFSNQTQQTTSSWGPGILWLFSKQLLIDLSYNIVLDDSISDDYITASIQWTPSPRTSLTAGYSKRFFGDSYNFDFQNRSKRLTNKISYIESLEVFDRNNYQQIDIGLFWCPENSTIESITQCFVQSDQVPHDDDQLRAFYYLEPIESNEFSLNRNFSWVSTLQLSRTSFVFSSSAARREGTESKIVNDNMSLSLAVERKISSKSKLTFNARYNYLIFDKNNPEGSRQEDTYLTYSAIYTKSLASSLSTNLTIQHIDRESSLDQYSYDEVRAIVNIKKEF